MSLSLIVNNVLTNFVSITTTDASSFRTFTAKMHKCVGPDSVYIVKFSSDRPYFYYYNDNKLNESLNKKVYGVLKKWDNNHYIFTNEYPYKDELCYYEIESSTASGQYYSDCGLDQMCLNLCSDILYLTDKHGGEILSLRITVLGENIQNIIYMRGK